MKKTEIKTAINRWFVGDLTAVSAKGPQDDKTQSEFKAWFAFKGNVHRLSHNTFYILCFPEIIDVKIRENRVQDVNPRA